MIVVIFEAAPDGRELDRYLGIAADLRPQLDKIDGFISIERFKSLSDPNRVLSLSFWENEAAVAAWRRAPNHRAAQEIGRNEVFTDYRIRVASVLRDYGMDERTQAPQR